MLRNYYSTLAGLLLLSHSASAVQAVPAMRGLVREHQCHGV